MKNLKNKILEFNKKNKTKSNYKIIIFLTKFFIIFYVLLNIIEMINLSFLTNFLAFITANYTGLMFNSNQIFTQRYIFIITNSCTGLITASILAAVIFALNKPKLHQKIKLFVFGALLILVINVFRIILILLSARVVALIDPDLIHTITWFLMSGLIILIWFYGTRKLTKINDFSELL